MNLMHFHPPIFAQIFYALQILLKIKIQKIQNDYNYNYIKRLHDYIILIKYYSFDDYTRLHGDYMTIT